MSYAEIPITANTCSWDVSDREDYQDPFVAADLEVSTKDTYCLSSSQIMSVRVGFPVYAITLMSLIGWVFLIFFLPTGMQAYPFDLIGQWVKRPIPMKPNDFNSAKADLAKKVATLMTQG